ncbi:MAG: flagellar hook-associated protein FlgL, partial [Desulfobacterales bacterium]|nr:flagellar hook-associated protein FlgL [Desulfobacterales bacterium]
MRVATKTMYDAARFELGNIVQELTRANRVVTTGKRISNLSDDPIRLTQCLNIKSSLSNLDQVERNISTARTWVNAGESALGSIKSLASDTKILCLQMANAAMNVTQRADAAEVVDGTLRQILSLANTEVRGQYIFAGTETDIKPLEFDDEANPTRATYSGDDRPFSVKIGRDTNMAVGRDGEQVFWEESITIDSTNNKIYFKEDVGHGTDYEPILTATIPNDKYTASELATAVENAMNTTSADSGYGITYEVFYNTSTKKFTIRDNGDYSGFLGFQLLWETGDNAQVGDTNTGGGSTLNAGSVIAANTQLTGDATISSATTTGPSAIAEGSTLAAGTQIAAGTTLTA